MSGDPSFSGDLTTLDFGSLSVGASLTGSAVVENPADGDCTMDVSLSGSGFSASPTGSQTVSGGTVLVIEISFDPTAAQDYTGTLSVAWSCEDSSGALSLALTGTGTEVEDEDDESDDSSDSDESSTAQRATLYVPSYDSIVNLGAAYSPTEELLTQNGFSATTEAHVFMRAAGSATFQADGQVWFQSGEDSLYTVAGENAYMIAGADLYLGGADYMGIMAGYAPTPLHDSSDYSNATPGTPAPVDGVDGAFLANNIAWESFGLICKFVTLANSAVTKVFLEKLSNWKTWFTLYIPAFMGVTGLAGTITAWATGASYKATYLFAEAGITAATPDYMYFMSGTRVAFRSLNSTVLGLMGVSATALLSARLVTVFGEVSARSATVATARSGKKVNVYSTLADLDLYGATMTFGGVDAGLLTRPTQELNISGITSVDMTASAPGIGAIDTLANVKLEVGALATGCEFTSVNSATIKVAAPGGVWEITADASSVSFKLSGQEMLKVAPGLITLGPSAGQVKMLPAATDMGSGAVKITPAGVVTLAAAMDLL